MVTNLRVPVLGLLSTDNSSTSAINTGANFTGTWEDISAYPEIMIAVATDQNGYYEVQFSPDGTNVDSTLTRYYRTTNIEAPHRYTKTRQYFRVIFYNNSGTNQTYFRLQVHKGTFADLNIPVDATIAQDYDSISTRPTCYTTEVGLGRRQGATTWNKFGYNEDIDTGTAEVIASFGGAFAQKLASGETLNIVSNSANDDSGSTGVNQLIVFGIDANWDLATEVVTMDGLTPVTTSTTFLGVNRMTIFSSGTANSNVGTITATASSSGNTMAEMPAGQGTTQQCIFYVPRNHQFLATWLYMMAIKSSGGGSNPEVGIKAYVYSEVVQSQFEVYRDTIDLSVETTKTISPTEPFIIGEKSIFWIESDTTANNTSVRARFSGKLIRDPDA